MLPITPTELDQLYTRADGPGFGSLQAQYEILNGNFPFPRPRVKGKIAEQVRNPETLEISDLGLVYVGTYDHIDAKGADVSMHNNVPMLDTEKPDDSRKSKGDSETLSDTRLPFYIEQVMDAQGRLTGRDKFWASPRRVVAWTQHHKYHPSYPDPWPSGPAPSVFAIDRRVYVPNIHDLRSIGMKEPGILRSLNLATMTDLIWRSTGTGRVMIRMDFCQVYVNTNCSGKALETKGGARIEAVLFDPTETILATIDGRKDLPRLDRLAVRSGEDPYKVVVQFCQEILDADVARILQDIEIRANMLGISLTEA